VSGDTEPSRGAAPDPFHRVELAALLEERATTATREHWERYLKGSAVFRGTPMAGIRRVVDDIWTGHDLADRTTDQLLGIAMAWFAEPHSEDRLAAVLLIAEHLAPRLDDDHDRVLALPFERGDVADWNVCDWYATKSLHAYLTSGDLVVRGPRIAAWTRTDRLWQRRAGVVAFVKLAASADEYDDAFVDLVLDACADNLVSDERFAHTGPGWVLRELSSVAPDRVTAFVDEHPELSAEAQRMATARLRPGPYRRR
jgi:3-methyladenine DNA glycosylase AlkD